MPRLRTTTWRAFHTGNRAARVFGGGRVYGVVGTDNQHHIGAWEIVVDFVHFQHDVIGHMGLGEQHVHVSGQATRHRVNAETHVDATVPQDFRHFADAVLGLRHSHAVSRPDNH